MDGNLQLVDEEGVIPSNKSIHFYMHFYKEDEGLFAGDIEEAMKYASSSNKLYLEYEMLLSAYDAYHHCDNRKVIMEGSAAVELCLVKQIEQFCDEKELDAKILLRKYRTLGDRVRLIGDLYEDFDTNKYKGTVVDLRNEVMHGRMAFPKDKDTDVFLKSAEDCLQFFHKTYY